MNPDDPVPESKVRRFRGQALPDDLVENEALDAAIKTLPTNYEFEIISTIAYIRKCQAKNVALQFPEGLLMYACSIAQIFEKFAEVNTVIMGDITYGACCVDDYTAKALDCDVMIHYGHSCLVPMTVTKYKTKYVFLQIAIDTQHFVDSVKANFSKDLRAVIAGTIQFTGSLTEAKQQLDSHFTEVSIPQAKPLSKGEVLGCTSPKFVDKDVIIFVADGRFHLESIMIANPDLPTYRYDPYNKRLTKETYDTPKMLSIRRDAVEEARPAKLWGVVVSTLGRQASPKILERVENAMKAKNFDYVVILLSDISSPKLSLFSEIDAFIQIGCPRLSVDWGESFDKPILSSYEGMVALEQLPWRPIYPMDYYSKDGGAWANYHQTKEELEAEKAKAAARKAAFAARHKKRRAPRAKVTPEYSEA